MGDLWIQVLTRTDADRTRLRREIDRKMQTEDTVGSEVVLRRTPDHVHLRNDAAALYLALGEPGKALTHFRAVTALTPDEATAWFNEGVALEALGELAEAQARYERALSLDDSHSAAHNNLSALWLKQGRSAEARTGFERAVRADPRNVEARLNLALVLAGTDEPDAALAQVTTVLAQRPDAIGRLAPVVWLLAVHPVPISRRPAEARRLAEGIVVATGRDAAALDVLAACHAALGLFEDAVRLAVDAESATPANQSSLRQAIRARLALYRAGIAFSLSAP
jgi:tetratricopeptide (TPR) repeat protein